jgi:hypothetical protein
VALFLYLKLQSVREENDAAWAKVADLRHQYNNARASYNMAGTTNLGIERSRWYIYM